MISSLYISLSRSSTSKFILSIFIFFLTKTIQIIICDNRKKNFDLKKNWKNKKAFFLFFTNKNNFIFFSKKNKNYISTKKSFHFFSKIFQPIKNAAQSVTANVEMRINGR